MMKRKRILVSMIAAIAFVVPTLGTASAFAGQSDHGNVAVRSFPAQKAAQRSDLLAESVSLTSSTKAKWGSLESLSIPKTNSPAHHQQEQAPKKAQPAPEAPGAAASRSTQRKPFAGAAASTPPAPVTYDDKPSSKDAAGLASFAQRFVGVPYVWGGTTPKGWDCSGFTQWIFKHFGVNLPRTAAAQRAYAQAHGRRHSKPQVGDLMAMNDGSHVAIYVGNGMMIHSPMPGQSTSVIPVYSPRFEYYGLL